MLALDGTKVLLNQTHSIRKVEQRCVFPVSVVYSEQYQQSESNLWTRLFMAFHCK
jgi:nitrate reductase NapAB chaperone NapD